MVVNMNNKKVIGLTLAVILGMIIVPTIYKVYKNYQTNLIKVVENEFLYQAKKCFNESNCSEVIYLSELYEKEYMKEKLYNPINKKYYSDDSYINLTTNEIKLIL